MNFEDDHDDDGPVFPHRKIMLAKIISLSVVVVLGVLLHIYVRYVLHRRARNISIHLSSRSGLHAVIIASLPNFVFKNDDTSAPTATECSVCLSMLEEGEMAMMLPNCNHTFHAECVDKWLNSNSTCPICRAEAEPVSASAPSEPDTDQFQVLTAISRRAEDSHSSAIGA